MENLNKLYTPDIIKVATSYGLWGGGGGGNLRGRDARGQCRLCYAVCKTLSPHHNFFAKKGDVSWGNGRCTMSPTAGRNIF